MNIIEQYKLEIIALKSLLEQKNDEIKEKDVELNQKDVELNQKDVELNQKDVELNQKDVEIEEKNTEIQTLRKLNDWYLEQFKLKQKEKFGKSSEKADPNQLDFLDIFNEAEIIKEPIVIEPELETVVKEHTRKKSKKGKALENLETKQVHYDLTEEEKVCDVCGEPLTEMKTETRRELVIIPAETYVVEHITHVYSCRNCDKNGLGGFIKKAPHPKALMEKSFVSPELLAYIMNQKYTLAQPLYRQEQEFNRLGIGLSRQNLSNWIIKGSGLLKPLYDEIKSSLLKEELLHADETPLEVLNEPGREATSKSYVWVYRTSDYNNNPVILYEYTQGRGSIFPKNFLKDWQGKYLHCDGYVGYKKLENVTLCGCLVHAKRKFHEAVEASLNNEIAKTGEKYIQKMFAIDKRLQKEHTANEIYKIRQEKIKPIFEEFYEWIATVEGQILPKSLVGKAISYAQNQKPYLSNFLLDGRIQLTNNRAEQSIKPFVIGRKNWLFANTPNGATASTIIYSIIQTAIANNLKPEKYLVYIFKQIQQDEDVEKYLPWSDEIPEYCKTKKPKQK